MRLVSKSDGGIKSDGTNATSDSTWDDDWRRRPRIRKVVGSDWREKNPASDGAFILEGGSPPGDWLVLGECKPQVGIIQQAAAVVTAYQRRARCVPSRALEPCESSKGNLRSRMYHAQCPYGVIQTQ